MDPKNNVTKFSNSHAVWPQKDVSWDGKHSVVTKTHEEKKIIIIYK